MSAFHRYYVLYRSHAFSGRLLRKSYFFDERDALAALRHSIRTEGTYPTDYVLFGPKGRFINGCTWAQRHSLAASVQMRRRFATISGALPATGEDITEFDSHRRRDS